MAKTFSFPIPSDRSAADLLAQAQQQARDNGIALEGDESTGRFRGTAEGTYRVDGDTLHLEVTKKPGLVPWGLVESALKSVFT